MATAAAAVFALWGNTASALALGQITILSALGEPLHAEIDIPEIDKEELATLRTSVAPPQAFQQAGLEFNSAMTNLQIRLKQKANGRHYLQLVSLRTINDPYVDLVIEARWSSGRILRDYTLLFDPPKLRKQVVTPTLPQQESSAQPSVRTVEVSPPTDQPEPAQPAAAAEAAPVLPDQPADQAAVSASSESDATPAQPEATPIPPQEVIPTPAEPSAAAPEQVEEKPAPPAHTQPAQRAVPEPRTERVTIKRGDTAGRIASKYLMPDVSLDQMLVAMLRANPDALINGNINLIRTGAVMTLPTAEQAKGISSSEARQILVAQSKDFNAYRQKLAAQVPEVKVDSADRQASGKIQAKVEESKTASNAPDKLTLSKGGAPSKGGTSSAPSREDKVAKDLKAKDTAQQTERVSRNIEDLNKLGAKLPPVASKPAGVPAPSPAPAEADKAATTPAVTVAKAPPPAMAPAAKTPPPPAAKTDKPSTAAGSAPVPAPPKKKVPPPPAAPAEPDLFTELLDNPMLPAAGVGLLALLAGLGLYRMRQRKQSEQISSAYLESKMQPDSFFGSSGGQRIDTNDGDSTNSSMVYSPAGQVDTTDDVDPVAEADVYLAYGRDLQAEEILKEAQRNHPKRVAIHHKLLEIYAKRRDLSSFNATADLVHQLTGGEGDDWEQVCELGADLDPSNPRYNPNAGSVAEPEDEAPVPAEAPLVEQAAALSPEMSFDLPATAPAPLSEPESDGPPSVLDLDLDFSVDEPEQEAAPSYAAEPEPAAEPESLSMDFNLELPSTAVPETAAPEEEPITASDNSLNFDLPSLPETPAPAAPASVAPAAGNGMEFDLSALSLDLGPPSEPPSLPPGEDGDPLETKLALAEEFNAIGDADGARALIQEIISEASGDMKARAEQALAQLS